LISVYEAIQFESVAKGGSTKPLIVNIQTNDGIKTFVVKVFNENAINQFNATCKEIYASVLAKEFDLLVPEFGIVEFSDSFIETLPPEIKSRIQLPFNRFNFGSELLNGYFQYSKSLRLRELNDYDIESIYAFDFLILNRDRNEKKPNILLGDDGDAYLIDHEQSLLIKPDHTNFNENSLSYNYSYHIFFDHLRRKRVAPGFDTFEEYLRRLDIHLLSDSFDDLQELGFNTEDGLLARWHLEQAKEKILDFKELLINSVT